MNASGFDLFVNALPTPLHVPATIEALEAGYHVVCEKPMAGTVKDFDRMTAVASRVGRVLAPFQNNRLQPFFDRLQEAHRQNPHIWRKRDKPGFGLTGEVVGECVANGSAFEPRPFRGRGK